MSEDYLNTKTKSFTQPDSGGQSTVTTPGYDLPGAFKNSWHNNGPSNGPTTGSNITVTETAQATLASAQHAAEKAFLAAEQYIPQSLMDRLQGVIPGIQNDKSSTMSNGKPSLPSQESESNFEPTHTGGVGSLPGGRNEEGIARLPHERKMDASASTGAPETQKYPPQKTSIDPPADTSDRTKQLPSMVINDPGYEQEARKYNLAAQQADANPGRFQGEPMSTSHPRSMTTSKEQTILLPPTPSSGRDSPGDNASTRPLPPTPGQASMDMSSLGTNVMVGSSATSTTTKAGNGIDQRNGNKNGHGRKPSFAQKLKGEVKVISGKLTKDRKKVAEGRALKAGELLSYA